MATNHTLTALAAANVLGVGLDTLSKYVDRGQIRPCYSDSRNSDDPSYDMVDVVQLRQEMASRRTEYPLGIPFEEFESPEDIRKVVVTPELAQEWLKFNTGNRKLKSRTLNAIREALKVGKWKYNNQTIVFGNGRLLDGQNRLTAIVQAGVPAKCLVVFNADNYSQKTMDSGASRKTSDTLLIGGELNATAIAAGLRVVWVYKMGTSDFTQSIPNHMIDEVLEQYPGVRFSAAFCRNRCKGLMPESVAAACHYLFGEKDMDAAQDFFNKLFTGVGLDESSPILRLRERLIEAKGRQGMKLSSRYMMAITIKTWNAYRKGKTIASLRFVEKGPCVEEMPKVV